MKDNIEADYLVDKLANKVRKYWLCYRSPYDGSVYNPPKRMYIRDNNWNDQPTYFENCAEWYAHQNINKEQSE